jgi:hypothetical protein
MLIMVMKKDIATDDEYVDSYSVLGPDGQEQLEALIDALTTE